MLVFASVDGAGFSSPVGAGHPQSPRNIHDVAPEEKEQSLHEDDLDDDGSGIDYQETLLRYFQRVGKVCVCVCVCVLSLIHI